MTFGTYLRSLRESRNLRQADLAAEIGVSPVYVCDIEKGHRYPPDIQKIRAWATQMSLSPEEITQLYDLVGEARNSAPPDILEYLNQNPAAKTAIRRIIGKNEKYNWDKLPL
ncbi:MAG: helix-turn-helix transcriptional regulator [Oscillospiraceae bacterium]|nr:helix-turn-helix transcriptional regulator [Oscillospiraceae bacterium]